MCRRSPITPPAWVVYGDSSCERQQAELLDQLDRAVTAVLGKSVDAPPTLDSLRDLLIQCGQLEQAAVDASPNTGTALQRATDCAAIAWLARWSPAELTLSAGARGSDQAAVASALASLQCHARAASRSTTCLTIKNPEGFAYYALYPEQYALAALRWASDYAQSESGQTLIVGIRSIGTTLSAVVLAALRTLGRSARRITVRPSGHPFNRRAEIDPAHTRSATSALIVDEGPGLSGSSMAAVAQSLAQLGIPRDRIAFFPGHDHGPGAAGDDAVRSWWGTTPRYVVPLEHVRWETGSLADSLAACSTALLGGRAIESTRDLSGGLWCASAYASPQAWPPICPAFERPKYLCRSIDGASFLWKFAGLTTDPASGQSAAQHMLTRLATLASAGWTSAPAAAALGFVATPWIDGTPLTPGDATPDVLNHVARYIAAVARPPLSSDEARAAHDRLTSMLTTNAATALGDPARRASFRLAQAAASPVTSAHVPRAGDGRLAPHEWLRTRSGALLKTDASGHDTDHTIIGPQPVSWDLAGATIEWALENHRAESLLTSAAAAGLPRTPPDLLRFHCAAYAAFRLAQCSLCADMPHTDPAERNRLLRAGSVYQAALATTLAPPRSA